VRALLAAAPADAGAHWSTGRAHGKALPVPDLTEKLRTVRAGEVTIEGTLPDADSCGLLVDGQHFEAKDAAFKATVRLPGDVLGRWVRVHPADGMRSGAGRWMRLRSDGIEPRVHLLEPAAGSALPPGEEVTVRALVYDSNLAALDVAGEAQTLRRDEVYVLLELPIRTPSRGSLKLPIRAVDAAGNEKRVELEWPVR